MTSKSPVDPRTNQHIQHERSEARLRERDAYTKRIQEGDRPWREHAGIMSVVTAVADQEFPRTFDALREDVGRREVITTKKQSRPLEEVLDTLEAKVDPGKDPLYGDASIPSLRDFHEIVQHHWEAVRYDEVPHEQRRVRGGARPRKSRAQH